MNDSDHLKASQFDTWEDELSLLPPGQFDREDWSSIIEPRQSRWLLSIRQSSDERPITAMRNQGFSSLRDVAVNSFVDSAIIAV